MIHPVILCGGSGTRLWPASRKAYPKQFAPLIGKESLYQMTLSRLSSDLFAAPLVITGDEFRFMATEQANEIGLSDARIIVEPAARDTAPAILIAALLLEDTPDELMLVAPSDHVIGDVTAFLEAVSEAKDAARSGALITFGIKPNRPETGYGYLELPNIPEGSKAVRIKSFREKPEAEAAQKMLDARNYLWNSGIFLFRVSDILAAYKKYARDLIKHCRAAIVRGSDDLSFFRLDEGAYSKINAISIDYAIMEKADTVMAVPMNSIWSDLGSWEAIWQEQGPDANGLATSGAVTALDCTDSYLRSEEESVHLVGLGLDNIVAVAMRDAVLVADKSRSQDVKAIVGALRSQKVKQADDYPRFHRPWGWYETLCLDTRFQVKRIMVKPGGLLSLQSHHHRSEHWIVVAGTAKVTIEKNVQLVTENQGVYIPLGAVHRLSNPGQLPMYLIEVQTGSYLGEDDIVRYEDIYDRKL